MTDLWRGTKGPLDARIMIVGEAWGQEEANRQLPFVGEAGKELNRMLNEAGIPPDDCFYTNLIADKPPGNELFRFFYPTKEAPLGSELKGLFPTDRIVEALKTLAQQVAAVRPSLIIGCGNYPLWAFTDRAKITNTTQPPGWRQPSGIASYRGSMLKCGGGAIPTSAPRDIPFLPVYHPAYILRSWEDRAVTVHDLRERPRRLGKWDRPAVLRTALTSYEAVESWLLPLLDALAFDAGPIPLAFDIETWRGTITCIGLTADGKEAVSIPFLRPTADGMRSFWTVEEETKVVKLLRCVLLHSNTQIIGQNWIYDAQYLWKWWRVRPRIYHDTLLAQHLLFPGTPKALGYLASLYCEWYTYWKEDAKEWRDKELDLDNHLLYNCDDVLYTFEIAHEQRPLIYQRGLEAQWSYLLKTFHLAFEMMDRGVLIDKNRRLAMTGEVAAAAAARKAWLNRVVPAALVPPTKSTTPWYQSPKQLQGVLYDSLGLRPITNRKTGNITTDDAALHYLATRYPYLRKIFNTILELRSLGIFQNNFLGAAIDADGRMRTAFNPAGTETFRWSSSENAFGRGTNLQNVPKGGEHQ